MDRSGSGGNWSESPLFGLPSDRHVIVDSNSQSRRRIFFPSCACSRKWLLVVTVTLGTFVGNDAVPGVLAWTRFSGSFRARVVAENFSRRATQLPATEAETFPAAVGERSFAMDSVVVASRSDQFLSLGSQDAESNKEDSEEQTSSNDDISDATADDEDEDNDAQLQRRSAAVQSVLLGRTTMGKRIAKSKKNSSVGPRRVGSATQARSQQSRTSKLLSTVQTVAAAAAASNTKTQPGTNTTVLERSETTEKKTASTRPHKSVIQSTIENMLEQQDSAKGSDDSLSMKSSFLGLVRPTIAKAKDPLSHELLRSPMPGTVLLQPCAEAQGCVPLRQESLTVRLAMPDDDAEIASLRLSVFSDFSPEVRKQFRTRSCEVLGARRLRGATCLVASIPTCNDKNARALLPEVILGSAECSVHEFHGTTLGNRRLERSLLYVTEVAVSPGARRCGIGTKLLEGVDELAMLRNIETLYLHVDVTNYAALELYEKAGYDKVDDVDPMFQEFTASLNLHDGAANGRKHFLLYKNLVSDPIWLPVPERSESFGHIGFEIPV